MKGREAMAYTKNDHTFAVCIYGDSPYLEECLRSLAAQKTLGSVILCTSTPSEKIQKTAEHFHLPLYVRDGQPGIAEDWNFAYDKAGTPLITLAHQDDIYEPDFLEKTLEALNKDKSPLIAFTDYYEIKKGEKKGRKDSRLLRVKAFMLFPLRLRAFWDSRFVRRRILSLGSPICCPSVTYVTEALPCPVFDAGLLASLDWQAFEKLSRLEGGFCYVPSPLMGHRIHPGSATTKVIAGSRSRSSEDLIMFRKFWPEGIARFLNRFYAAGQDENRV